MCGRSKRDLELSSRVLRITWHETQWGRIREISRNKLIYRRLDFVGNVLPCAGYLVDCKFTRASSSASNANIGLVQNNDSASNNLQGTL